MTTTTNQFTKIQLHLMSIKDKRTAIAELKASIKETLAFNRQEKAVAKALKAAKAAERREIAIAKAQARLQKLLEKQAAPVGAKALKANRKPGKVTTYGAEDNAIASAIMAKKASA